MSAPVAIEPGWIDYNGHLNAAYYSVLFDRGAEEALDALGLGSAYARARRHTIYTAETHLRFLRELHQSHRVTVAFQLLGFDAKRLHVFQEARHPEGGVAATCETLFLHVDMEGPRVVAFPEDRLQVIEAMSAAQAGLPAPEGAGRAIALKRKG